MAPVRALLLDSQRVDTILRLVLLLLLKAKRIIHKLLVGLRLVVDCRIGSHEITDHG